MKIKLNNLFTILSLCLTALLLVFVVRAWYAVNKTASVEAGSGATAGGKNLYLSTSYGGASTFTYSESAFTSGGWGTEVDLTASNILIPASTFDATDFYYTNDINPDGSAIETNNVYNFSLVTTSSSYYYVSKRIYLTTSEEEDLNVCLRNVSINQGTDDTSDIYKSVRLSITSGSTTKIFKADSATVYPANSISSVAASDPALAQGGQANSTFSFVVLGAETIDDVTTYNVSYVDIKVWVEGQHSDAIATYAGTGFTFNLSFQSY